MPSPAHNDPVEQRQCHHDTDRPALHNDGGRKGTQFVGEPFVGGMQRHRCCGTFAGPECDTTGHQGQRVCTRLTRKPVETDETANSKKKLEATNPSWRGPSFSSRIIGTAAIPITALSAKLITMKMKSSTTTAQAQLRS